MNGADIEGYWVPAVINLFGPPSSWAEALRSLERTLGFHPDYESYRYRSNQDDFPIPEHQRAILKSLAGPHGKTLLKIYMIQKETVP